MSNRTEYLIGSCKLIWNNPDNTLNNLYIEGLWNMRDTVGYDERCVDVSILSCDMFTFNTFNCIQYTMKINDEIVTLIDKKITK